MGLLQNYKATSTVYLFLCFYCYYVAKPIHKLIVNIKLRGKCLKKFAKK